jgi:hypothetical protein
MATHFTIVSRSPTVVGLVGDYARGLGCEVSVEPAPDGSAIRAILPDGEAMLELLTHVALSASKSEIDISEPLCRVTYRHGAAASKVTLDLRIIEFVIDSVSAASV